MENNMTATTLTLRQYRAWMIATLFVAGNVILPQVCHLIPQGGLMLLPIYFFTIIAAYRYGWQVGLVTAIASPLVNSALFGMPAAAMLPIIMLKGALAAGAASVVARRHPKATLLAMVAVVASYQLAGCAVESAATASLATGLQDLTLGLPGIALQILCGWLILRR